MTTEASLRQYASHRAEPEYRRPLASCVAEHATAALQATVGSVVLLEPAGTHLKLIVHFGHSPGYEEEWRRFPVETAAPFAEAVRTGRPVVVETLRALRRCYPAVARAVEPLGVRSMAAMPISLDDGVRGAIGLGFADERGLGEQERAFVAALGVLSGQSALHTRALDAERAARREAEQTREQLHQVLESITDAVYAVGQDWRFTYVNRRAEELWGRRREDLLGRNIWVEFPGAVDSQSYEALQRAMRERVSVTFDTVSPVLRTWVEVHAYPAGDGLAVYFHDVSERKRAEQELRRTADDLQAVLDVVPIGIGIARDPACRDIRINPAFAALLGVPDGANASKSRDDAATLPFAVMCGGREVSPADLPMQRAARERRVIADEVLDVVHGDGRTVKLLEYAAPLYDASGDVRGAVGAFVDITERARVESDRDFLLALGAALHSADVAGDADAIGREATRRLAEHLGVARCGLSEVDEAAGTFTRLVAYSREPAPAFAGTFPLERWGDPVALAALRRGEPAVSEDTRIDPRTAASYETTYARVGIRAFVIVPVVRAGQWVAMLGVHADSPRRWMPREVALVQQAAGRTWLALQAARALAAERAARERTERLQALTAALGTARTPLEVAQATLEAGVRGVGAPRGTVLLLVDQGRAFELVAACGYEDEHLARWRRFPNQGRLPVVDVVATRAPVIIGGRDEYLARYPELAEWIEASGFHGSALIPLIVGEVDGEGARTSVLGLVGFDFDRDREFPASECGFLQALADVCAQALARALAYQAALEARAEAERANRVKAEFLASMSHELRTPLTAIIGYAELVGDEVVGPVNATQRDHIERIKISSDHLRTLIEEILSFSRIEAGREDVTSADVDLRVPLEEALAVIAPLASRKGLVLRKRLPAQELPVRTDATKVRQIVINLLSNAVKFTDVGEVSLTVAASEDAVLIAVSDTGSGIAPEHLPEVFAPFWQADQSLTRTAGGTGLGLSVARRLARMLGGDVTVESRVGAGSTFTLALPRVFAEATLSEPSIP